MKQIKIKPSKVGSLHEHLGVAKGDKIPASKLKIKAGDSPAIRKKKQFALNARKWKHEFGGRAEYGAQLDQYNNLGYNWQQYPNPYMNNPYPNPTQQQEFNPYNMQQDMNQAGANIQANTQAAEGVMGQQQPQQGAFKGGGMLQYGSMSSAIGDGGYVYDFFKEHPEYLSGKQQDFNFYDQNYLQNQTDQLSADNYSKYMEPIKSMPAQKLETNAPDMTGALSKLSMKDTISMKDTTGNSEGMSKANIASMVGDAGLGLADTIGSATKSDSPFGAAMRGGSKSVKAVDSVTKPFEAIPGAKVVTAPLKAASFIFGSIMSAISQRIKNQEFKKAKDYRLYMDRNIVPLTMSRGQGGEYGLKIKPSLIDEIHSDFDKYLNSK